MNRPVVITCAVTGGADSVHLSPAVPVTPEQIADAAIAAGQAGAAIAHIHVRDPKTGKPSSNIALYREVVSRIRRSGSEVIINLTTGPGARFNPDDADLGRTGPDSTLSSPLARIEHVLELQPEICSLDTATFNYGALAMVNVPRHLEEMAGRITASGVKPEAEIFDMGHAVLACDMAGRKLLGPQPVFQLCLGIPWGAPATTEAMSVMRNLLPAGVTWSAFGIARHQFPMAAQAAVLGGHVRVGLEDNLYLSRGVLAPDNAALVKRAVTIIEAIGYSIASSAVAREILGLPRYARAAREKALSHTL